MRKLFPLILSLILSTSLFAQTNRDSSAAKVAYVDTVALDHRQNGIKVLVAAVNANHSEYYELYRLDKKIGEMKREINLLIADKKPINDKYLELKELEKQYGEEEKRSIAQANKQYSMIVTPVMDKIKEKLAEFAAAKGYAVVVEKGYSAILVEGKTEDITTEFIKFCNDAFDKEPK